MVPAPWLGTVLGALGTQQAGGSPHLKKLGWARSSSLLPATGSVLVESARPRPWVQRGLMGPPTEPSTSPQLGGAWGHMSTSRPQPPPMATCKSEKGDVHWCDPTIKAAAVYHSEKDAACQRRPHRISLLPAPPKCLFKPTHCSANWITFHVKIDLLKQQQRRQIKTAATAKVQRLGGLGEGKN